MLRLTPHLRRAEDRVYVGADSGQCVRVRQCLLTPNLSIVHSHFVMPRDTEYILHARLTEASIGASGAKEFAQSTMPVPEGSGGF